MDIEKAKKIIEKGIKPEYERLRQYDGYKYTGGWLEAINVLLNELDKKEKEIEELKQDNAKQWEERCRLTFKLQETEERLSQIELQILEED